MSTQRKGKRRTGRGRRREKSARFALRLYVSGLTPNSVRAIDTLQALCEEHLAGHYKLEVIDVFQQPERAKSDQIVAVPTLIKRLPPPVRRAIGELSNKACVLLELGLEKMA